MKNRSVAPMWAAKLGYAVMSAVCCVIGVLLIRNPGGAAALGRALGAALTAFGGVKLVGYFSRDLFRLAFQYDLEFGILLIALGTAVLLKPEESLDFFLTALGTAALADGLFKIRIARDARRFGIESWWMILLLAGAAGAARAGTPALGERANAGGPAGRNAAGGGDFKPLGGVKHGEDCAEPTARRCRRNLQRSNG